MWSGCRGADGSGRVVVIVERFPRTTPRMPVIRISRATWSRPR